MAEEDKNGSSQGVDNKAPEARGARRVRVQTSTTIAESFNALKGSGAYKRDLKGKRNELDALRTRIKNDKVIQADNLNILSGYDALMDEQQGILSSSRSAKDKAETQKHTLESELRPWEAKLVDMKDVHRKTLKPLQDAFDSAKRSLLDIEDELSSAKREYDSLERQLRRAGDDKRGTLELKFSAQKPTVQTWEVQRSSAVNLKNQAEAELESKQSAFSSEERPLEAEIDRLKGLIAAEKATIEEMASKMDGATKRIEYSRHVKDNPDETHRLGELIAKNEAYEVNLSQSVKDIQAKHDNLKSQSLKARVLLIVGAVVLLAIIGIVAFLVLRANGVI
jgi:chromosome segregation ATPase